MMIIIVLPIGNLNADANDTTVADDVRRTIKMAMLNTKLTQM